MITLRLLQKETQVREVRVHLVRELDESYPVSIGTGILANVLAEAAERHPRRRIFVLTDSNVKAAGHLATLLGGAQVDSHVIDPPGESSKHLDTVRQIIGTMEEKAFGRDSLLIALGGGTVGDIGGFVAAIFKRGVPYIQVPTTTVAQADSSIGGKAGVDSDRSKNAFGAFKQPVAVTIDVATLSTLDERNYRAGLVESVKHALIADEDYLVTLEQNLDDVLARGPEILEQVAERNVRIKAGVVAEDPEEANLRRVLNYGHTVGHAIETASGFDLLHGEAVALGILAADAIAVEKGFLSAKSALRIATLLDRLGMPSRIPDNLPDDALFDIMTRDKKAQGGVARFVLLDALGRVHRENGEVAMAVDAASIQRALATLRT